MESEQKKLITNIKKAAKANQQATAKVMVKDLVRSKNYVNRFIMMKTQLNAVGLKIQTMKSHEAMSSAMKGVTKCLVMMNKQVSMPELQKIMQDFVTENEKSELQQEIMDDTIDDAMAEEGSEEAENAIYNQVMDELGLSFQSDVPEALSTELPQGQKSAVAPMATPAGGPSNNNNNSNNSSDDAGAGASGPAGAGDPAMSELESRLNNLRR